MIQKEIVPGCSNCDMFSGACRVAQEVGTKPSLAEQSLIDPAGVIEGPPTKGVQGFICIARGNPGMQQTCSDFVQRTTEDDVRDQNI